ncbi:MAG: UPF0280 family protein [Candidatus Bathyarchaeota archaeon]|nr:MAG: UPF0280 family protein [Candidatus Bathyarchaeota archaeon]
MKYKRTFNYKETRCTITADSETAIEVAISSIKRHRSQLEKYVRDHPKFLHSLKPVQVDKGPAVARLMAEAAKLAGVGPMAAVAGVLADLAVEDMVSNGAQVAVVENGGEVYAVSNIPINVALVAGDSPLSKRIGFRLEDFPIGIATSSGLYSHALSFGEAEAVTVFAVNAGVADAAATAVGNLVKGEDWRKAVECGIAKALSIEGVNGVLILYRGLVGKGGQIPKIVKVSATSKGDMKDSLDL